MEGALRISEAASLGLHAMAYIASREDERPVSVADASQALGVSEAHLGKVLQRLARFGYLSSRRGPRGGYSLARGQDDVSLLEIYEAVDGPLRESSCLLDHPVCDGTDCILGDLVRDVNRQVREHLTNTRLSDLAFDMPI